MSMVDQFRIMKSYEKISPFFFLLITDEELRIFAVNVCVFIVISPEFFSSPSREADSMYIYNASRCWSGD